MVLLVVELNFCSTLTVCTLFCDFCLIHFQQLYLNLTHGALSLLTS